MKVRASRSDRIFDIINVFLIGLVVLTMIYPIYFTVIASFSDPYAVVKGQVYLWIKDFSLDAYKGVLEESRVWIGYRNSLFYTFFGVCLNLMLTIPAAYVLSKRTLPGRGLLATYFLIPMYFGGGLIPTYLIVKDLHLLNQPYTLVILGGLSIYNMIVTRVYFQTSIPEALYESAPLLILYPFVQKYFIKGIMIGSLKG